MRRAGLERNDLLTPLVAGAVPRPAVRLQQMHKHSPQIRMHRVEFDWDHVLNLLDDVVPVGVAHPLPGRETTEQRGLLNAPGESIVFVEIVRDDRERSRSSPRVRGEKGGQRTPFIPE